VITIGDCSGVESSGVELRLGLRLGGWGGNRSRKRGKIYIFSSQNFRETLGLDTNGIDINGFVKG